MASCGASLNGAAMIRVIFFNNSIGKYLNNTPLPSHGMGTTERGRGRLDILHMLESTILSVIHAANPSWETMTENQYHSFVKEDLWQSREGRTIVVVVKDREKMMQGFDRTGAEFFVGHLDENLCFQLDRVEA
jgi:hypothetical protein